MRKGKPRGRAAAGSAASAAAEDVRDSQVTVAAAVACPAAIRRERARSNAWGAASRATANSLPVGEIDEDAVAWPPPRLGLIHVDQRALPERLQSSKHRSQRASTPASLTAPASSKS